MVRIRLQRHGRRKKPFYHIVIADSRSPRDGRFIERIGAYNPMTTPASIELDTDKAFEWLLNGAQPSDTVRAILRVKGVLYRKHLHRGVLKGAFSQEEAEVKLEEYMQKKQTQFDALSDKTAKAREEYNRRLAGTRPVVEAKPEPVAEAPVVEQLEDAESPVAETAAAEAAKAEPETQAAIDQAVNNADEAPEPVEVVEAAEEVVAEEPAIPEVTTDQGAASTEAQAEEDPNAPAA